MEFESMLQYSNINLPLKYVAEFFLKEFNLFKKESGKRIVRVFYFNFIIKEI